MSTRRLNLEKTKLEHLYLKEEKSSEEIARILGCGASTVRRYLDKYNIPQRNYNYWTKPKNLVGKIFGFYEVLRLHSSRKNDNAVYWECRCLKCGTEPHIVQGSGLKKGNSTQCKECKNKQGKKYKDIPIWFWKEILRGVNRRNTRRDFEISIQDLQDKWDLQKGFCAISGIKIELGGSSRTTTASIDRINNDIGYIPNNIWWVHKDINKIKHCFELGYLMTLCSSVEKNINDCLATHDAIRENKKNYTKKDNRANTPIEEKFTFFIDIDATLVFQHDENDITQTPTSLLPGVKSKLDRWREQGHKIVLTTARDKNLRKFTEEQLNNLGIEYDELICGLNHGERILINNKSRDGRIKARSYNTRFNGGIASIPDPVT